MYYMHTRITGTSNLANATKMIIITITNIQTSEEKCTIEKKQDELC